MSKTRDDFHNEVLLPIADNCYCDPPENVRMKYPCIVYSLADIRNAHANNAVYKQDTAYKVTVIDKDPDSVIVDKVSKLPKCSFSTRYTVAGLHHTVFRIYY